jgi:hypothetical protein
VEFGLFCDWSWYCCLQELFCKAALFDSTGNADLVLLSQRVSACALFDCGYLLWLTTVLSLDDR